MATTPDICPACHAVIRTRGEHEPLCLITAMKMPPELRPWEQIESEHGLNSLQRRQAVDLLVESDSRRLNRGQMTPVSFMLIWGNGYWRSIAAEHLIFLTRTKEFGLHVGMVMDSVTERDHPASAMAALQAAALMEGEIDDLMIRMDDEAIQLLVDCLVQRIDVRSQDLND